MEIKVKDINPLAFKKELDESYLPKLGSALSPDSYMTFTATNQDLFVYLKFNLMTGKLEMSFVDDERASDPIDLEDWCRENLEQGLQDLFLDISGRDFMYLVLDSILVHFEYLLRSARDCGIETIPLWELYEAVQYDMDLLDEWRKPEWYEAIEAYLRESLSEFAEDLEFEMRLRELHEDGEDPLDHISELI